MPNKPNYDGSYYGHNQQGNGYRTEYQSSRGGVEYRYDNGNSYYYKNSDGKEAQAGLF
jgi:hypothetical protein